MWPFEGNCNAVALCENKLDTADLNGSRCEKSIITLLLVYMLTSELAELACNV